MKIRVGSENPVKIEAVKQAFSHYFDNVEVIPVKVTSDVPDQPTSLREIVVGAKQRAQKSFDVCDFSVGLEAGIFEFPGTETGYMDMCVCAIFNGNTVSLGGSPCFEYPKQVIEKIFKQKKEVGTIMDELLGDQNTKQKQGAVGILTNNGVPRTEFVKLSIMMALSRIINKKLY